MIDQTSVQTKGPSRRLQVLDKVLLYGPFAIAIGLFACCLAMEFSRVELSQEIRDQAYSVLSVITMAFSFLLSAFYGRKYSLGWVRSLIFSFTSFFTLFYFTSKAWQWLDIQMLDSGALASFRSIIFLPVLCLILSRFCKVDTLNLCDYLTPYFFFQHGIVTVACWISGCCAGRACSWGLRNPLSGATVFPTQPCIILLSLAVAFWGLYYSKKHVYKANGKAFAYTLCIYGIGRYVIELFSDDARVWWMLSWLAICSLVMIIEGFVIWFIASKHDRTPS